jgi:hypothetical protein
VIAVGTCMVAGVEGSDRHVCMRGLYAGRREQVRLLGRLIRYEGSDEQGEANTAQPAEEGSCSSGDPCLFLGGLASSLSSCARGKEGRNGKRPFCIGIPNPFRLFY